MNALRLDEESIVCLNWPNTGEKKEKKNAEQLKNDIKCAQSVLFSKEQSIITTAFF